MSEPKNHHLLPGFYLRGFCNPEVHEREEHERDRSRCWVWAYDKERGRPRRRGVKTLSVERHYYSADAPDGERDSQPERTLARIEGNASQVIRSLRYGSAPRPEELIRLAIFVATMKFRVSSYRPYTRRHVAENKERIRNRAFPSKEALREDLRRYGHPEAEEPETVERIFRDIHSGARELTVTKNHMLENMFDHSRTVAKALLEFDWTFLWAPERTSFVTSDDPVLVLGPDLKAPSGYVGEAGFASPGATKVLPLTQHVCLVVGDDNHSVSHGQADRDTVRRINLEQTRHYERWLIARDEALLVSLVHWHASSS